jgi:hypothetical protein
MQRPTDIAFTSDIAEIVAKELNMPKELIEDHVDFMVHWIKKLTMDPEVLTVNIPSVGRMYLNWTKVERDYTYYKDKEEELSKHKTKMIGVNRKRLEKFGREFEGISGYNRHRKRSKLFSTYFSKGKSLRELEEWQNAQ